MLEALLKKKSEKSIITEFDEQLIKQGKFPQRFLEGLKFIAKVKSDLEKPETKKKEKKETTGKEMQNVEKARRYSAEIVNALIEYTQRCDFLSMSRTRFIIKSKDKVGEIFFLDEIFIIQQNKISKLKGEKLVDADPEELKKQIEEHRDKETKIDFDSLHTLKKIFGDFELLY